jgi:formamidopyrimidine-DNA glycosylase
MPELPELQALVEALAPLVSRAPIAAVPVAHFAVMKTATPPITALAGRQLAGAERRAKHLLFPTADGELVLHLHLMTNGRMAYLEPGSKQPGGAVLLAEFADGGMLAVTERATRKQVRVRLGTPAEIAAELDGIGPEPLDPSFDEAALATALARGGQLSTLLRDQRAIAGIGRAYANEILHAARLGPFDAADRLGDDERARLHSAITGVLADGIERFRPRGPKMIVKKGSGVYDIHGHAGDPCPRCATPLAHIDYESYQIVYCPTCHTCGKLYADRRLSRLLK